MLCKTYAWLCNPHRVCSTREGKALADLTDMELMLQLTNTGWIWKRMPSQTPEPYMLHGVESETKVSHYTSQVIHNPQS
eukprot:6492726-Amphidinium_carterae.6